MSLVLVIRRSLDQDEYIRLTHAPSQDVFKTFWPRPIYSSWSYVLKTSSRRLQDALPRRLQDAFKTYIFENVLKKTSSRRPQGVFKTSCENVLRKTPSRHFQDILQICLQDVFMTYYQVKLFLLTQFQDVFETYSKRFWDVLLKRLSTGGLPRSRFWEIYGQCRKFPRMIKVSQVLVFHFIF